MRFIVYGAGGIGGVTGGHLARSGHDVILIGRSGHITAISRQGLRLVTPTGTYILRIPAVTEAREVDFRAGDLVLLTMKGQNTEEAMHELRKVTPDIPIFCLQNGIRNEEIVSRFFPRVYGVMVRVGAVYLKDGEAIARRDPPGWFIIGRYPRGSDELAETVAKALRHASFYTRVTSDVMPYKWGKLMSNLSNTIGAITNGRGREGAAISRAAERELLAHAGIHWISQEEVAKEWPEITAPLRGSITGEEQSSTWQSLAREQGSVETDFLNGEVVRLAERLGQRAPVNEMLAQISQEMAASRESPGKYTPSQLSTMVGLAPPSGKGNNVLH